MTDRAANAEGSRAQALVLVVAGLASLAYGLWLMAFAFETQARDVAHVYQGVSGVVVAVGSVCLLMAFTRHGRRKWVAIAAEVLAAIVLFAAWLFLPAAGYPAAPIDNALIAGLAEAVAAVVAIAVGLSGH